MATSVKNATLVQNVVVGGGDFNWTNTSNAKGAANSTFAAAQGNTATGTFSQSNQLYFKTFAHAIPLTATINGISVSLTRKQTVITSSDVTDLSVQLVKNGVPIGEDKAAVSTSWPTSAGAATYGSGSDLWDTAWTPADINDADWGVVVSTSHNGPGTAQVDAIEVTVTYTASTTTTTTTTTTSTTTTSTTALPTTTTTTTTTGAPYNPCCDLWPAGYKARAVAQPAAGANSIVLKGDLTCVPLFIGFTYNFLYRFNDALLREATPSGGLTPITQGRLQVRTWGIRYANTGYFEVVVTPDYRGPFTYKYTARHVGVGNNLIDTIVLSDGVLRVPVHSKNDAVTVDIQSCSFLPLNIVGAEWEAMSEYRAQRIA